MQNHRHNVFYDLIPRTAAGKGLIHNPKEVFRIHINTRWDTADRRITID